MNLRRIKVIDAGTRRSIQKLIRGMFIAPGGPATCLLNNLKNVVYSDEAMRKHWLAAVLWVTRQLFRINPSASIDGIRILINRGIEDHYSSDPRAVRSRRGQAPVIVILEYHARRVGRSTSDHRKQTGPRVRGEGRVSIRVGNSVLT